jgi:hypothetical protein
VRRLTAWIGGIVGGILAYRFWRRRTQVAAEPVTESAPEPAAAPEPAPEPTEPDGRAEELREKLAETRAEEEPSPPEAEDAPSMVDERRQQVHEEGRAALDEMRSDESAQ